MKNPYLKFKDLIVGRTYLIANRRSKYGTGYEQTPIMRVWTDKDINIKEQVSMVLLIDGSTWKGTPGFKFKEI